MSFKTMRQLNYSQADFSEALNQLLKRDADNAESAVEAFVRDTIARIRIEGDTALLDLTHQFDGHDLGLSGLEISSSSIEQAYQAIPALERDALQHAAQRIRDYHQRQLQTSWEYAEPDGTVLGQKVTPIRTVGIYVPGGKAAYPSSVLMNAIPAKVAGVKQIIMVSPSPQGQVNNMVLAAAKIAGVDRVFQVGGAQAIAALAYGTESIPAVDKITGPGNSYVATAKKQLYGKVGIDMIAGPSEVLVIADESVDPDWVAMDLFAQAEHDEQAQSILLTQSSAMAEAVANSINRLLPEMERATIIEKALADNGAIIVVETQDQVVAVADVIAPEHLEIFTTDASLLADRISNAGAIFIGPYSAESLGDYCAGPNHVLPTSGTARFSSPLGVYDFQKRSSIIKVSEQGAQAIAKTASIIARGESLTAHARSAEFRIKDRQN